MNMKKLFLLLLACLSFSGIFAQTGKQARAVLDKTANVLSSKGGASAHFVLSNKKLGTVNGDISIKGNKFQAKTPQAIVWFNGKTQWTYLKHTEEVNVTTPTQAQQMMMNPYTFINIYKTGYSMTSSAVGGKYEVHLMAQDKKRSIQELYITIDKNSFVPLSVKMRQHAAWTSISISNFKRQTLSDKVFVFKSKDFPQAEIVDLR